MLDVCTTNLPPKPTKVTKYFFLCCSTLVVEKENRRCVHGSLLGRRARSVEFHVLQLIKRELIVLQAPTYNVIHVESPIPLVPLDLVPLVFGDASTGITALAAALTGGGGLRPCAAAVAAADLLLFDAPPRLLPRGEASLLDAPP